MLQDKFKLLKNNQHKFNIIDKIMQLHPGYGSHLGWSSYVGGMVDSGYWKEDVLLDKPLNELEVQYNSWMNPPPKKENNKSQDELRKEFLCEIERKMLGGM